MIIKLVGADFSANNLGTIAVQHDLTVDTLAILSHFTRSLTTDQKYSVQNFIEALKAKGIWSAINGLYLPILAGDVTETLYNIKTSIADDEPSATYYGLSAQNGLNVAEAYKGVTIPSVDRATIPLSGSQMNLHLLTYNLQTYAEATNIFEMSKYSDTYLLTQQAELGINSSFVLSAKSDGNKSISSPNATVTITTPKMFGITQRTDAAKFLSDVGLVSSVNYLTNVTTDNTYTNIPMWLLVNYLGQGSPANQSYGFFSVGTALTDVQMIDYSGLVNTLMTELAVA